MIPGAERSPAAWLLLLPLGLLACGCQPPSPVSPGVAQEPPASQTTTPVPLASDPAPPAEPTPSPPVTAPVPASLAPPTPAPPAIVKADAKRVVSITFDDLKTSMPPDAVFDESMLTDRIRQLDGRRVRIRGFIFPAVFQQKGITKFPLVMNTQCKFGPGGEAHCIIIVDLAEGVTTDYTIRPIAVQGRLTLKPWNGPDGNTWALYHLAGEQVE